MYRTILLAASMAMSTPSVAYEDEPNDPPEEASDDAFDAFRLGGSCAGLSFLNRRQIEGLVQVSFQEELHAFCYPEEPFDCSDYSLYLQGLGTLEVGDDERHCRLQHAM